MPLTPCPPYCQGLWCFTLNIGKFYFSIINWLFIEILLNLEPYICVSTSRWQSSALFLMLWKYFLLSSKQKYFQKLFFCSTFKKKKILPLAGVSLLGEYGKEIRKCVLKMDITSGVVESTDLSLRRSGL